MKRRKRFAFVPRSVIGASFGAVVPAIALWGLEACSSSGPVIGVAGVAYCCFEAGVAADAFGGDASDGGDAQGDAQAADAQDAADAPGDAPGDG